MKPALLDVNVLLALAWPNHQHHDAAHAWFHAEARHGWASCALTHLGFIRLSANPAYTPAAVSPTEAASLLGAMIAHKKHHFWESPPAADSALYAKALGHQQVNDAYLVEVARQRQGRLVTFDTRLAVHGGADDAVFVISASE
ncbi:MAG: TA system VapC family ribonuclease toxin [Gammaproteobacteria bacterium]